jgi:predicted ATPase
LNHLHILSGPPGAGKTTLLKALAADFVCVAEPARRVIATQRAAGAAFIGDAAPEVFIAEMLALACADHAAHVGHDGPVVFDRGVPDLLAFADHFGVGDAEIRGGVVQTRYHPTIFWLPSWRAIYETDTDRQLDYEGAARFGERIRAGYVSAGYHFLEVPIGPVAARAEFVRENL